MYVTAIQLDEAVRHSGLSVPGTHQRYTVTCKVCLVELARALGNYWPNKRMAEPLGATLFLSMVISGAVFPSAAWLLSLSLSILAQNRNFLTIARSSFTLYPRPVAGWGETRAKRQCHCVCPHDWDAEHTCNLCFW